MFGGRVRELRQAKGLTQAELAARAGVSRQLVGAVEQGRHLPRVDAAVALAAALGVPVESLQRPLRTALDPVVGPTLAVGTPVRAGRVGDRLVCAATTDRSPEGWAPADGIVAEGGIELLDDARPGAVVVGCDPALGLAARLVTSRCPEPVLAVTASTADALEALAAGRAHACVAHGPESGLPTPPIDVDRWHLSRWQVGLAARTDAPGGWRQQALDGRTEVIQRRRGAGSQAAFERALARAGAHPPAGPVVEDHLEAAWLAARTGLPAVTIEPAARSAGLAFHPLEWHVAQLWVGQAWRDEPGVRRLSDTITSAGFERRLAAVGGYDLAGCGTPAG